MLIFLVIISILSIIGIGLTLFLIFRLYGLILSIIEFINQVMAKQQQLSKVKQDVFQ